MTYEEVREYWKNRSNIKLNDDRIEKILFAYKNGATHLLAAKRAGVTYNTLRNWLNKGEQNAAILEAGNDLEDPTEYIFVELWQKVSKCQSDIQIQAFQQIQEAAQAPENWRAAVAILEKCCGYASNADLEISGTAHTPFTVSMRINTDSTE